MALPASGGQAKRRLTSRSRFVRLSLILLLSLVRSSVELLALHQQLWKRWCLGRREGNSQLLWWCPACPGWPPGHMPTPQTCSPCQTTPRGVLSRPLGPLTSNHLLPEATLGPFPSNQTFPFFTPSAEAWISVPFRPALPAQGGLCNKGQRRCPPPALVSLASPPGSSTAAPTQPPSSAQHGRGQPPAFLVGASLSVRPPAPVLLIPPGPLVICPQRGRETGKDLYRDPGQEDKWNLQ